jgi:hypothetical protein
MMIDALVCPGFFCVACEIRPDVILADIAWSQDGMAGKQVTLKEPKKPDSIEYTVTLPGDLATLHTEVILNRVFH